jgi:hypothetical protein
MKSFQTLKLGCGLAVALAAATAATPRAIAQGNPTAIAVFDFELEDASAGTGSTGGRDRDGSHMDAVSAEVRRVIAQSGRYRLVDVAAATDPAVRDHALRHCNGCDAGIAAALGAEQSLIGVVTRISSTEYEIGFRLRDARSGALITTQDSDLRMGANYAWSRGASRLIKDRLLETAAK